MNLFREGHDSEKVLIETSKDELKSGDIKFGLDALLKKGVIKVTKRGKISNTPCEGRAQEWDERPGPKK